MENLLKKLTQKKQKLDQLRPLPQALVKNLEEWFKVEFTYTSNAIEGNTLSRAETALVVEKGLTIGGKSLREHLEAVNHVEALEFVRGLIDKKHQEVGEREILKLHQLILQKIDEENAGRYRTVAVRIAGSSVVLPNPAKVPQLMQDFVTFLQAGKKDHPIKVAADAHFRLVSIHPFSDGNGRMARLLMNLLLMQQGYPPALIRRQDQETYIESIEKGQLEGEGGLADYYQVIFKAAERSLDIYLEAMEKSKL